MNVLVINCGSSSVKYQLVDVEKRTAIVRGKIERIGKETSHQAALSQVLQETGEHTVDAVGHRVVHGGDRFTDSVLIDDSVVAAIEACVPLAPLHNPVNLAGIRAALEAFPEIPHIAVFDTAFHYGLPRRARSYAISPELAEKHGVRRYGFHGPSHAFVCREAAEFLGRPMQTLRLVSCHLGNGASVTAVEHGRSVETSMGMTPLEGLVMGTRSGDIDPGVLLHLMRAEGWSPDEADHVLNRESGLKGLSGYTNDLRDLEEKAAGGDERARLAIACFAYRIRKYIGAYVACMGGADAVVLTGGIGENARAMRQRILQRFEYLGLLFDDDRNAAATVSASSRVCDVSRSESLVKALVVATDEQLKIAEEAAKIVGGTRRVRKAGPITIATSARHFHLNEDTFKALFGPDAQLTEKTPLSQPGQFAANERVNLIGPRRRIDNVRILGPLRKGNQVEISRTDEFHLGVDAPIRRSGQTAGSAPITVEGPHGTVHLEEGLVCAWRHIHMTPEDADVFGVDDGDEVAVAVTSGPRELVFGDVLVRVKSSYKLEMHIDTDEANAAELSRSSEGLLVPVGTGELISRRPKD